MKTDNSNFFAHPRNYDLNDYCFPSKSPLDNSIIKHRQSCKGRHSRRGTVPRAALMHESEKVVAWFKKHFLGKRHITLLSENTPRGPMAISLVKDNRDSSFKFVVRSPEGSERHVVGFSKIPRPSLLRRIFGIGHSLTSILRHVLPDVPISQLHQCAHPLLPNELLNIDERQVIRTFKFGVGYVPAGGVSESDMLAVNMEDTSESFRRFLRWLGTEITLKGWKGYRGGLDTKRIKTVYTNFHGNEIIYHVSPLLPSPTESTKRTYVERKRHLGNDKVIILFQDRDGASPFRLETLGSHLNHAACLVREAANGEDGYEISIALKEGVPPFNPELPDPRSVLKRDEYGREWFLYKLIEADRASYCAPVFASKINRTRTILLKDVFEKFSKADRER